MRVRMANGPIAGYEKEITHFREDGTFELLDSESKKVRQYRLDNHAYFVREWPDFSSYEKEVAPDDNSTGS